MTITSPTHLRGDHLLSGLMGKSWHVVLKGCLFIFEGALVLIMLVPVLLFVAVAIGLLLHAIVR